MTPDVTFFIPRLQYTLVGTTGLTYVIWICFQFICDQMPYLDSPKTLRTYLDKYFLESVVICAVYDPSSAAVRLLICKEEDQAMFNRFPLSGSVFTICGLVDLFNWTIRIGVSCNSLPRCCQMMTLAFCTAGSSRRRVADPPRTPFTTFVLALLCGTSLPVNTEGEGNKTAPGSPFHFCILSLHSANPFKLFGGKPEV